MMLYRDAGRQMVMSLKHGGRIDVALMAAQWMERAGKPLFQENMLIAPVPLHWTRLFTRTFNQSAALAQALAKRTGYAMCPDLLLRGKRTQPLEHKTVADRFGLLEGAMVINPRRRHRIAGRPVLLIDDVMTSGATLSAATHACQDAGCRDVFVLTLARVAKDV
ncbi:ComF family protein [Aestuariivita sp.]|uniref:ComF family protein n=1 Tax=Aestuariivita sp. TaxID=1872407 RepID=UPI003BB0F8BD